jgi:anti-sigma factor RsiW
LGAAEAEALAAHLSTCVDCRQAHRRESALDAALGRLARPAAPAALAARLSALAAGQAPQRSRRARGFALAAALAAALALLLFFGQRYRASEEHAALASAAVSDHLRVLYAERGPEVESGGMHQVKPWFEGRLDFAPVLAFDGDEEFPLLGGSVALFQDHKAAAFEFRHRLHRITLLVFRADGLATLPSSGAPRAHTRSRGFDVVVWRRDDLGYALVSDMNGADLDRLASKIAGR